MFRTITQTDVTRQHGGVQNHLDHCKMLAYAGARAKGERQIAKPVAAGRFRCRKPRGIEAFGIRPKGGVPVHDVR